MAKAKDVLAEIPYVPKEDNNDDEDEWEEHGPNVHEELVRFGNLISLRITFFTHLQSALDK